MSTEVAAAITRLVALGVSVDEAAIIVSAVFVAGVQSAPYRQTSADLSADRRREKDRERKREIRRHPQTSAEFQNAPLSIEVLEEKKEREAKRPADKRGSRLPSDWMPTDDDASFGASLGYTAPLYDREVLKFRNHFESAPGKAGVKLDWHKTFRNWLIRGAERLTPPRQLSVVPTTPTANAVFVLRGSPQWLAWTAYRGGREPIPKTETAGEGQWMRTEWPPQVENVA